MAILDLAPSIPNRSQTIRNQRNRRRLVCLTEESRNRDAKAGKDVAAIEIVVDAEEDDFPVRGVNSDGFALGIRNDHHADRGTQIDVYLLFNLSTSIRRRQDLNDRIGW